MAVLGRESTAALIRGKSAVDKRPPRLSRALGALLAEVRACRACAGLLPFEPRPVLRAHQAARVLIVGQAPGTRVHETGIPWNDPSGDRLRRWLAIDRQRFYDERRFAIIPVGYCYPGRGASGDMPPRKECAELWLARLLARLPNIELTVLVGQYAHQLYLGRERKKTLTETVRAYREYGPRFVPLPHPSPRNQMWLRRNPWFEAEVVPALRRACRGLGVY
jgi:uracil-DNA glycosylase